MVVLIKIRDKTHLKLKVFAAENGLTMLDIADKILSDFLTNGSLSAKKKVAKEIRE